MSDLDTNDVTPTNPSGDESALEALDLGISYDQTTAVIVVDVQNDFADPAGSLYVDGGDLIVPRVNAHMTQARLQGATVVITQDWHPASTPHFIPDGGVWPVHCVRQTWGAALHPDLVDDADAIVRKGTGGEDGYSAFSLADPVSGEISQTGLADLLRARHITDVVVVGLAADVCIKATALDAVNMGFGASVDWSATRPVELEAGDGARAREELIAAGVSVVD